MNAGKEISSIVNAQGVAEEAHEGFENLVRKMLQAERIFYERGISVTVNRRIALPDARNVEVTSIVLLFCGTFLNVRLRVLLGESEPDNAVLRITNLDSGYAKDWQFDFRGSQAIMNEPEINAPLVSATDAGCFMAILMADLIESQTRNAQSAKLMVSAGANTNYPTMPKPGQWWGNEKSGFMIREQLQPGMDVDELLAGKPSVI